MAKGHVDAHDHTRLRNIITYLRRLTIRWTNLYHNERHQALERIKKLEEQLKNGQ